MELVLECSGYKDVLNNIVHYKNWKQNNVGKTIIGHLYKGNTL